MTTRHRTDPAAGPRLGLAAAIGGWSARNRKTTVLGRLLCVVLATVLGGMAGSGNDRTSDDALAALRGPVLTRTLDAVPGVTTAVTGDTAASADFNAQMTGSILPVFAFVMGFAFLLMLLSFRSVVVAATALVLNLLRSARPTAR